MLQSISRTKSLLGWLWVRGSARCQRGAHGEVPTAAGGAVPCAWFPTGGAQRLQEGSSGGLRDRRRRVGFVVTLGLLGFEQFGVLLLFAVCCQQVCEQQ